MEPLGPLAPIASLAPLLTKASIWFTAWLIQATLVASVVWLTLSIGRRWAPKIRHALVSIAFLAFAIPPVLNIPMLPTAGGALHSLAARSGLSAIQSPGIPVSVLITLTVIWAIGALTVLTALLVQAIYLARLRQQAQRVESEALRECLAAAAQRMELNQPPALLFSKRALGPCLTGLADPAIVLHAPLAEKLQPRELTLILAHELAHLRQGDLWLNAFRAVLCAVWWPHPLAWLLARESRRIREEACDDAVLVAFDAPRRDYAHSLLEAAAIVPRTPCTLVTVGALDGNAKALADRLKRMADPAASRLTRLRGWQLVGIALLCVLVLNGPSLAVRTVREGDALTSYVHLTDHASAHRQQHRLNDHGPGHP